MARKQPREHFSDMSDDTPWNDRAAPSPEADPHADVIARVRENRRKNSGRKYKPQKNRQKLLCCLRCLWKCRASQAMINLGVPGCPVRDCADYGKTLAQLD